MNRIYQQIINGRQRYLLMVLLLFFTAFFFAPKQVEAQGTPLCAEVKIVIEQKLSLERQAFDAKMVIGNGLQDADVEDVSIELLFFDQNEQPVIATTNPDDEGSGALFFYRTDSLKGIDSIDGEGQVAADSSAEIHWLIIPALGASADTGTLYYVGAKVTYTLNGITTTVDVTPDFIVVKPMPELVLDYFLPTDVYADDAFTDEIEPPVPFTLGVRIKNIGSGAAVKTAIESAQPKIVENKLNLLIDFKILGGYVSDEPAGQSLLLDFGNIDPQSSKVGRWNMITTLSGQFVEFNAYYSHADELGGAVTSLLEEVNTHTLVHDVKVDLPGRDSIRDFLALDGDVLRVYESDGVDTLVADQSSTAQLRLLNEKAEITYQAVPGFTYVKLADPYQESRVPIKAVRSDGKVLPPENVWLSKTRNEDGESWSYYINIFDANTTGSYDVFFADNPYASISGFVFDDINGNGIQEDGERGVGVAKLTLTGLSEDGSAVVATAYTDVQGRFGFKQIQPGRYALEVASADGMIDIAAIAGDAGGAASLNKIIGIDLGAGAVAEGYYFAKQWSTVIPPNARADLSMEITASTVNPNHGDQVAFVYRVENAGPDEARQVKVAIVWPEGLTKITCEAAANNGQYIDGVWSIDKLDADTAKEINCTAQASDLSVERTIVAMVASQTIDPAVDNNEASVTLQAVVSQLSADLSIRITASTLNPGVGEQVTFVYTAHNAGPDKVKQAEVTMTWPIGLSDVNCQADVEDQYSNGVWTIDQLLAGTSKELTCTGSVTDISKAITVLAEITSLTDDENLSNNEHSIILTPRTGQAQLSGIVYEDQNQNGVQDTDELGLAGVAVMLSSKNAAGEYVQITVHTDSLGQFLFNSLDAATYTLSVADVELMKNGVVRVGSAFGVATDGVVNSIVLTENTSAQGYQFAKYKIQYSSIAGQVLYTPIGSPQTGFEGLEVYLTGFINGDAYRATAVTDQNGNFIFEQLSEGVYKLTVQNKLGLAINGGSPGTGGGTVFPPNSEISAIPLKTGIQAKNYRFYLREVQVGGSSISGFVYLDENQNGVFDENEKGIPGRKVTILGGAINQVVYSDENGAFSFKGLIANPGIPYLLGVDYNGQPFEGSLTAGTAGGNTQIRPGVNHPYIEIRLAEDTDATGYLFGRFVMPNSASISGMVFEDSNGNGVQDENELSLSGIVLKLTGSELGIPYGGATTQTGVDGRFTFEKLNAGTYTVSVAAVEGMGDLVAVAGSSGGTTAKGKVTSIKLNSGDQAQGYMFGKQLLMSESDLSINIAASTLNPVVGQRVSFVYTAHNAGPELAKQVQADILWPEGLTDIDCQPVGGNYYANGIWTISQLDAGVSQELNCSAVVADLNQDQIVLAQIVSRMIIDTDLNNNEHSLKIIPRVGTSAISGMVYDDENGNDIKDVGETGISSVELRLHTYSSEYGGYVTRSVFTDEQGFFIFDKLFEGEYELEVEPVSNMYSTGLSIGSAGGIKGHGLIYDINLSEGMQAQGYEFGKRSVLHGSSSLSGIIFNDLNRNGVQDNGELGLAEQKVLLTTYSSLYGTVEISVYSNADGKFLFEDIAPETYTLSVENSYESPQEFRR